MKSFADITLNGRFYVIIFSKSQQKVVLESIWVKVTEELAELVKVRNHTEGNRISSSVGFEFVTEVGTTSVWDNLLNFDVNNIRVEVCP